MQHIILKKNGTKEAFSATKIINAISCASDRAEEDIDYCVKSTIADSIKNDIKNEAVSVLQLHTLVIEKLGDFGFYKTADAYREFRNYKKDFYREFEKIKEETDRVLLLGDRENANFESSLTSTKGSLVRGYLTKSLYKKFYLTQTEQHLIDRGDIYVHDLKDMIFNSVNCCLFDIDTILKGGFEMSNIKYTEPKSVLSALQVIGDVTLVATAQQFGGFTLSEIDKVLLPYAHKSYTSAYLRYLNQLNLEHDEAEALAMEDVKRELEQGFQSLELKLNTVPCSRGDFAFTTLTFGLWDKLYTDHEKELLELICNTILETRMKGHGGRQVVFPKLVYLWDEHQSFNCLDKAVECSSKCMYPDYLSLTGDPEHNYVAHEYLKHGTVISPMGCRAYLSPWKDEDSGEYVANGRCNIGAVSLNIPVIMAVCKKLHGDKWKDSFWTVLMDRLQVIREFFKRRYQAIANTPCSTNPLAFTQGGFYKGFKKADEPIGDLIKYMTASFGVTALNESTIIWKGKTIAEDNSEFALEVLAFIKEAITNFKLEDGHLYAMYGTPAESLAGTQAKQYKAYTGEDLGEYFTNSFHMHVSEKITPMEKQDLEVEAFHVCSGGHINYVRVDNPSNHTGLKALITRGLSKGFYQGVNFDACHCETCGADHIDSTNECKTCGSSDLTVISRVCGYMGYTKLNGGTRMNDTKLAEIADRCSM